MKVIIAGAGGTGCFAALLLARAGHEVTVLERDRLRVRQDVETAAVAAFRAAAPQIVQPHIIMARARELLLQRLPDVYRGLLDAGVQEAPLHTQMPPSLPDKDPRPGDDRLTQLLSRRSTIDLVLLRAVAAEPGVTLRPGVKVTGLLTAPAAKGNRADPAPPHVVGVATDQGDLHADITIDATGRRSAIDDWLTAIGAARTDLKHAECGLAYYSRHYRIREGAALPGSPLQRMVMALDEFMVGLWPADNGAVQLGVVPLAADHRFRAARDPAVFTRVLNSVPAYKAWLDVLDPITGVFPMAGLHNTLRRLVIDQVPAATGLHAIGDTVCTTNPTLSRGLALALTGAADLVDVLDKHPDDPRCRALALDDLVTGHVEPFYVEQALVDGARLEQMRHLIFGDPAPEPQQADSGRVSYAEVRAAMPFDPVAFRGFWKVMGMMATPEEVYTDPEVVARTRAVLAARGGAAPTTVQPSREELAAALAG